MRISNIHESRLKDGNRLIHVRAGLPIAYISVWFGVGSRFDPVGKEGLSHFLEHLFMKTSDRFPLEADSLRYFANNGIRYNATTSPHRMWFRFSCADFRAKAAMKDFLSILSTSYLDKDLFRTEKNIIEDERMKRLSLPSRQLLELSKRGLFPGTLLARSVLGSKESVDAVSFDDVAAFLERHITKSPKTFVVVSEVEHEELSTLFADFTAPASLTPSLPSEILPAPLPIITSTNTAKHAEVSLNFRTCSIRDVDDVLPLQVLCKAYLTGSNFSRLGNRLRTEKRLTYGVGAEMENAMDTGYVMFRFSVPPSRVAEALKVCDEEITKVGGGEISSEELSACKEHFAFSLLEKSMDPESVANWYAHQALAELPTRSIEDAVGAVHRLTADDLQRVARKYLVSENRSVAVLGPVSAEDVVLPA